MKQPPHDSPTPKPQAMKRRCFPLSWGASCVTIVKGMLFYLYRSAAESPAILMPLNSKKAIIACSLQY